MAIRDHQTPHLVLGGVRFAPPSGQRAGLPQPHWLGHAVATPAYLWSQQRSLPGHGVCHFSLAGRGLLDRGGRQPPQPIPAGWVLLYEPGDPACPYRGDDRPGASWEFLSFFFTGQAAMTLFLDLIANHGRVLPVPTEADWYHRLRHLGCRQYGERSLAPAEGAQLVQDCLIGLMRFAETKGIFTPARDLIAQAETWIAAHLHEGVGVAEVAAALDVSREHLARTVRTVRGTTLSLLLDRQRVQVAQARLRSSDEPISTIAAAVGLRVDTFHRIFRRIVHCTPDTYRRTGGAP